MLATYTLFYVVTTWVLSYGTGKRPPSGYGLGFNYIDFLQWQLIAVLFFAAMLPVSGALADRFGRRATLLVVTAGIVVYGVLFSPLLAAAAHSPYMMLVFLIIGMTLMGLTFAPMSAVLPELFPTNVRYTGSGGIAYNAASILGAAVAPFSGDLARYPIRRGLGRDLSRRRGTADVRGAAGDAGDQECLAGFGAGPGARLSTPDLTSRE